MSWDYDPRQASAMTYSSMMNTIIQYQERGALLREIATATHRPLAEIHREIMRWLALKKAIVVQR